MMSTQIERIQTGLTRNYVSYWTVRQALKEAAQNIAYGSVKSGRPARLEWVDGIGFMEDFHTGFEKRHLYLGESEQRDDRDGLGNFGEGWKIFLLVMARSNLIHRVDTVGFSFWGEMEPTPHGPEVLVIHVEPNNRQVGTMITAECSQEDFESAISSFAPLQGIDCSDECVIPGRYGELWINGVRIEQGDNTNPLNLHYAYHLKDRSLMNRDRSQVNVFMAMLRIRSYIIARQPEEFVRQYVAEAMSGNTRDDIQKGPVFGFTSDQAITMWRQVIAEAHNTTPEKLVLSSHNADIDKEALYRGYQIIRLPHAWRSELECLGFKRADEVVKIRPNYKEVKELFDTQAENLRKARLDAKRALGLASVRELPQIKVVEEITGDGYDYVQGLWDPDEQVIYIRDDILWNLPLTVRVLIHEAVHWQTGEGDNQPGFTRGFENAILRLLGHEV